MIHHVIAGERHPPIVFVHGFACAHDDWSEQLAYFSRRHQSIAVDLPGHGLTPGGPDACSIEQYGADVAALLRHLSLPPAVLVGHSMGCRVVTETAVQAPANVKALVLVDGSQFAPEMAAVLRQRFAVPGGYPSMVQALFNDMFTAKSDPAVAQRVITRAGRPPEAVGAKLLSEMQRYDVTRLTAALATIRLPVLVLQTTYSNERRERGSLSSGQTTPYLEMIRRRMPQAHVEIIPDTGHFPQLDESEETSARIERFLAENVLDQPTA